MKQVIFLCQTPYHLLVSASYCRQITDCSIKKVLVFDNNSFYKIDPKTVCPYYDEYILIPGNQREQGFFQRQLFKLLYEGHLWKMTPLKRVIQNDVQENILVCFNDCNKIFDRIADVISMGTHQIIMVEEGAGSYCITELSSRKAGLGSRIWNRYCLGSKDYPARYLGDDRRIDTFIMKEPEKFPAEKLRDRKLIKQEMVDYSVFDSVIEQALGEHIDQFMTRGKWILYVGDEFDDDINMPESVENIYLEKLFTFLSNLGYGIVIKPHPREPETKYRLFCADNILDLGGTSIAWIPMECLADRWRPKIVLSPCSSALNEFVSKEYSQSIVFVYRLFPKVDNIEDAYFERLSDEHKKVSVVNDYNELKLLLG